MSSLQPSVGIKGTTKMAFWGLALFTVALCVAGNVRAQTICEEFGSTTVSNRYVVMNNRWGTTAQHCIEVQGVGFKITHQDGVGNNSPVSYPAVFYGCHYTNCSPGTNLPMQVSKITSAKTSVSFSYVDNASYDAAYDIWLDPKPLTDGNNAMEIMIWFRTQGSIQPIGAKTGSVSLAGHDWAVWQGTNGKNNVISYVVSSTIGSLDINLLEFLNDGKNRGLYTDQWYLTSIQAGFEPWTGGVGLAVNSFSANINNN